MAGNPDDDPNEYVDDVTERYVAIPSPLVKFLLRAFVVCAFVLLLLAATGVI